MQNRGGYQGGPPASHRIAARVKAAVAQGGFRNYPAEQLVSDAEELAQDLMHAGLETTQLRKFLSALDHAPRTREDYAKRHEDVLFLKYQLAYSVARQKSNRGDPVGPLYTALEGAFTAHGLGEFEDFQRLRRFVEAVVAYHKFHGGRESRNG